MPRLFEVAVIGMCASYCCCRRDSAFIARLLCLRIGGFFELVLCVCGVLDIMIGVWFMRALLAETDIV